MKLSQRLANHYSLEQLRTMQTSVSLAIDRAKGLHLAAFRRRFWTLEKVIEEKRNNHTQTKRD